MTDLSALIERVESGTGSDRELDGKIVRALSGSTDHWFPFAGGFMTEHTAPELTGSLDAVLSLIEAKLSGMSWEVRRSGFGAPSQAMLWDPMKSPPVSTIARTSVETSPIRALLPAALRAIQETRNADR
jgi:hypothetical protein